MRRFDLGLNLDYCNQWGVVEAIREIFQNAYDAQIMDEKNKMYFNYQPEKCLLRVGNKGGTLTTKTLLLGESAKRDNADTIGTHGEGYKVATVVLKRLGKGVTIYNRGAREVWTARIVKSRRYKADVVAYDIEKVSIFKSVPNYDLIFEISGITSEEYQEIVKSNLHLQNLEEDENYIEAGGSRVLTGREHAGMLFVGGLFVTKSKMATYGYDFKPSLVKLDRDRGFIDNLDLQFLCGKVLCQTNNVDFINDAKEVWDGEYIRLYVDRYLDKDKVDIGKLYDKEYNEFIEEHGKDAIPVTDEDEFNHLAYLGYRPVMMSSNRYHYVTRSSSYVPIDVEEDMDRELLCDKLSDWFEKYVDKDSDAFIKGKPIIEEVISYLSE